MPIGEGPWEEIDMEFMGEIPDGIGYNTILVIINCFTKI